MLGAAAAAPAGTAAPGRLCSHPTQHLQAAAAAIAESVVMLPLHTMQQGRQLDNRCAVPQAYLGRAAPQLPCPYYHCVCSKNNCTHKSCTGILAHYDDRDGSRICWVQDPYWPLPVSRPRQSVSTNTPWLQQLLLLQTQSAYCHAPPKACTCAPHATALVTCQACAQGSPCQRCCHQVIQLLAAALVIIPAAGVASRHEGPQLLQLLLGGSGGVTGTHLHSGMEGVHVRGMSEAQCSRTSLVMAHGMRWLL
jgi:hypothetical protein